MRRSGNAALLPAGVFLITFSGLMFDAALAAPRLAEVGDEQQERAA